CFQDQLSMTASEGLRLLSAHQTSAHIHCRLANSNVVHGGRSLGPTSTGAKLNAVRPTRAPVPPSNAAYQRSSHLNSGSPRSRSVSDLRWPPTPWTKTTPRLLG